MGEAAVKDQVVRMVEEFHIYMRLVWFDNLKSFSEQKTFMSRDDWGRQGHARYITIQRTSTGLVVERANLSAFFLHVACVCSSSLTPLRLTWTDLALVVRRVAIGLSH